MDVFGLPDAGPACHLFWLGPAHGHDAGRQPFEFGRRQKHEPGAASGHRAGRAVWHQPHRALFPRDGRDVAGVLLHKAHHVQCGQPAGRRGPHCQRLGRRGGGAYSGHSAGGFSAGKGPQAPGHCLVFPVEHAGLCRVLYLHWLHLCVCVLGSRRNDGLQPLYLPLLHGLAAGGACHFCGRIAAR